MAKLKVPPLQHLARNWRSDPQEIKGRLVALATNGPTFNYEPLFSAVRDMLVFDHSYEQIAEGIRRGITREAVRDNLLGVLPLIRERFDGIAPSFVQSVGRRYYPVGRGLMVPFDPPVIYGAGGQIHFPWFSFWRSNPLTSERMSLFVTIVEEVLLADPDLENARFVILDFSAAGPKLPRTLKAIDAEQIPRVSEETKVEMLSLFAEGYFLAEVELEAAAQVGREGDRRDEEDIGDQLGLFDDDR
jgi:hypothetical protein